MLFEPSDPPDVLKRLGFRCITPTPFTLSNRTSIIVHADGWMLAKKDLPKTEAEALSLRLYHVYYCNGETENLDEIDVMNL